MSAVDVSVSINAKTKSVEMIFVIPMSKKRRDVLLSHFVRRRETICKTMLYRPLLFRPVNLP